MGIKVCKSYTGVSCIDGSCPMANSEEYSERCIPVVESCSECHRYKGCADCYFGSPVNDDEKDNLDFDESCPYFQAVEIYEVDLLPTDDYGLFYNGEFVRAFCSRIEAENVKQELITRRN